MLERHIALYGTPPRQTTSDGGYASLGNLKQAKAFGVRDVPFHKKRGLAIEDMAKSRWVYRKLRNFRAGIEANISCLKRAVGLARCTWRGLAHLRRTTITVPLPRHRPLPPRCVSVDRPWTVPISHGGGTRAGASCSLLFGHAPRVLPCTAAAVFGRVPWDRLGGAV
jgi:IS5 family transposase